jgi:hypothetical protein
MNPPDLILPISGSIVGDNDDEAIAKAEITGR